MLLFKDIKRYMHIRAQLYALDFAALDRSAEFINFYQIKSYGLCRHDSGLHKRKQCHGIEALNLSTVTKWEDILASDVKHVVDSTL